VLSARDQDRPDAALGWPTSRALTLRFPPCRAAMGPRASGRAGRCRRCVREQRRGPAKAAQERGLLPTSEPGGARGLHAGARRYRRSRRPGTRLRTLDWAGLARARCGARGKVRRVRRRISIPVRPNSEPKRDDRVGGTPAGRTGAGDVSTHSVPRRWGTGEAPGEEFGAQGARRARWEAATTEGGGRRGRTRGRGPIRIIVIICSCCRRDAHARASLLPVCVLHVHAPVLIVFSHADVGTARVGGIVDESGRSHHISEFAEDLTAATRPFGLVCCARAHAIPGSVSTRP
jgi:hypothetical protein